MALHWPSTDIEFSMRWFCYKFFSWCHKIWAKITVFYSFFSKRWVRAFQQWIWTHFSV